MIDIKIDFNPDDITKAIAQAAADDIRKKLNRAGVHSVTIHSKKDGRDGFSFYISGDPAQVQKATEILSS